MNDLPVTSSIVYCLGDVSRVTRSRVFKALFLSAHRFNSKLQNSIRILQFCYLTRQTNKSDLSVRRPARSAQHLPFSLERYAVSRPLTIFPPFVIEVRCNHKVISSSYSGYCEIYVGRTILFLVRQLLFFLFNLLRLHPIIAISILARICAPKGRFYKWTNH